MVIYAANADVSTSAYGELLSNRPVVAVPLDVSVFIAKKVLLIDVFNTFILPSQVDERFTPRKEFRLREGFMEFLEHYRQAGKRLGIHTEAMGTALLHRAARIWGLGGCVDSYFGSGYIITDSLRESVRVPYGGYKDFSKMAKKMKVSIDEAVVIGDGESELESAQFFGIDLILVPRYELHQQYPFSFANLIFSR